MSEISAMLESICGALGLQGAVVWRVGPRGSTLEPDGIVATDPDLAKRLRDAMAQPGEAAPPLGVAGRPRCDTCLLRAAEELAGVRLVRAVAVEGGTVCLFGRADAPVSEGDLDVAARLLPGLFAAEGELRRRLDRAESALRETESLAKLGHWEWDLPAESLSWSDEVYRIFGLEPQQFGSTYGAFVASVHPDDRAQVEHAVESALVAGAEYRLDHRIVLPDGGVRVVHEQAQVSRDGEGRPIRMFGTVQDVSEQRELEARMREAEKLDAVGHVAGGLAHDFNNILTGIMSLSWVVQSGLPAGSPARADVGEIMRCCEQAAALTRHMQGVAVPRMRQIRPLDLDALLGQSERLFRRVLRENVRLDRIPAPGLPAVLADPAQVEQVLLNLVLNARDAMPRGGTVELSLHPADGFVEIDVRDDGPGMPAEVLERVFEPFFTTKASGTGLGLPTARSIVEDSGGTLAIESAVGKGTVVRVRLPVAAAPAERAEAHEASGRRRSATVLLVEDDAVVREVMARALTGLGYRPIEAASADEALARMTSDVDLVVTDVVLPGTSGPDLVLRLREQRRDLRAIFVTGYVAEREPDLARFRDAGGEVNLLLKPFSPVVLAHKIERVLA